MSNIGITATPRVVDFEGIGPCFYRREDFRAPRKGEFFLSGAIVSAYRAPNDLSMEYQIVVPTYRAKQIHAHIRGEKVTL